MPSDIGRVTHTLVRDREAAIGGSGKATAPVAAFAGTPATSCAAPLATPPRVSGPMFTVAPSEERFTCYSGPLYPPYGARVVEWAATQGVPPAW